MNIRLALIAVVAALAVGGCTSGAAQPRVATANNPTAAPSVPGSTPVSPSPEESDYDKALRYTRCMNDHGEKYPDPVEGKPLETSSYINGESVNGWRVRSKYFDECKQYLPATWPIKVDAKELAKTRPFAECMRKRGIGWPEPDANGMVPYSPNPGDLETPEYRAAEEACRYLYDDPANNQ